jgi:hypothetical protein
VWLLVECLLYKHEALSSTPVPPKEEKKRKRKNKSNAGVSTILGFKLYYRAIITKTA